MVKVSVVSGPGDLKRLWAAASTATARTVGSLNQNQSPTQRSPGSDEGWLEEGQWSPGSAMGWLPLAPLPST